jgi:hypothetical protein
MNALSVSPFLVIDDNTFKAYVRFDKQNFESYDIVSSPEICAFQIYDGAVQQLPCNLQVAYIRKSAMQGNKIKVSGLKVRKTKEKVEVCFINKQKAR